MDSNRDAAYKALLDIEKKGAWSNLTLNEVISRVKPDDPAFVREIVYGTLKNKYLLDCYLRPFVKKGYDKLKPEILTILRMGAYQLVFMDSVPEYAAVSETVKLAKKYMRGMDRFANGVLRSLAGSEKIPELPPKDEDLEAYLSAKYSCRRWIAEVLTDNFGKDGAEIFLKESNKTPDLVIRVNLLKNTPDELITELEKRGFSAERSDISARALKVKGSGLLDTDLYKEGRFSVQDEASICAVDVLDPKRGMRVMDMCAAPGGKTVSIAELMGNEGEIRAFDVYEHRVGLISKQAERCGADIICAELRDGTRFYDEDKEGYDRVLCDVPCSGLGVIRRKPEIKYNEPFDIGELNRIQSALLRNAAEYVRPGGYLVYSTCTVDRRENENITGDFLRENKGYTLKDERRMGPEKGTDGFYIAKIFREA